MMRILAVAAALAIPMLPGAGSPQRPTAYVQGIVVSAEASEPLARVRVELRDSDGEEILRTTYTDPDGIFYFPDTRVGEYRFVATRLGWVTAEYGQRYPASPALSMTVEADQVVNVPIVMARAGVISGRVTDKGRGVGLADVIALRARYVDGELQTTEMVSDRTNDLGEFHLFWLPPGDYLVVAAVWDVAGAHLGNLATADGDDSGSFYTERRSLRAVLNRATGSGVSEGEAHIPTYYPGTTDPLSATPIRVGAGSEVREIHIDATPQRTYRVLGRVNGLGANPQGTGLPQLPPGFPPGFALTLSSNSANVRLYPVLGSLQTSTAQGTSVPIQGNGSFEFTAVAPGVYTLVASANGMSAKTRVEVRNSDVLNANVTLGEGYNLTGQIRVEGSVEIPASSFRIQLRDDPPFSSSTHSSGPIAEDGTFAIPQPPSNPDATPRAGPPGGNYRVLVTPILTPPSLDTAPTIPSGLERAYVKSITVGQADVLETGLQLSGPLNTPMVVTIGTDPGALEGRIVTLEGAPAPSAWVALLPESGLRYRVDHPAVTTDAEGGFRMKNVPPGDYHLFAWEIVGESAWQDAGFMRRYEAAGVPVTIGEGALTTVEANAFPPEY